MPALQADITTDRASRYLAQFCKHAAAMGSGRVHRFRMHGGAPTGRGEVRVTAQWDEHTGTVDFDPWGRAHLEARPNTLLVRLDGADDEALTRMRTIIDNDLNRFGRTPLTVVWHPAASATDAGPGHGAPA